jgi:hypothetical protein
MLERLGSAMEARMLRLLSVAALTVAAATSTQAMMQAPIHEPGAVVTQVAYACGAGRTRVNGVCVARTTKRHVRRAARRCIGWHGGVCVQWQYY